MRRTLYRILLLFTLLTSIISLAATFLAPTHTAHAAVSGFVTHSGSQLQLNGSMFRFSGANMYWLGLDENVGGVNYPTSFRVDDGFATAQEMGATVVRSVNAASSVGCSLCLEPSLGSFNSTAFQYLDYAIKSAGDHNIRLILPLVDNYHYYAGGKHIYTDWRGDSNENDFYTNTTVIGDFEQFISTVLNHVNSYTGVAYKNDPTILGWEEGNELYDAPGSWIDTIATYIKSVDPNHLVGFSASDNSGPAFINQDSLAVSNIDFEDAHFYPMSISRLNSFESQTAGAGKAFYAGEYDWSNSPISWNGNQTGDPLSSFLSTIETNGTAGDTFWSLFPHNDTYGYVQHGDGFTLHYPGDSSDMQSRAQALRTHAYTMRGQAVPANGTPSAPLITSVNGQAIAWRGSTPSANYSVERSMAGSDGPWTVICNQCATDNNTPWSDTSQPSGTVWYRVRGYNLSGVAGDYSPVYQYNGLNTNLIGDPGYEQQISSTLSSPFSVDVHDSSNCAGGVNLGFSAHSGNNDGWLYCNGNVSDPWASHSQVISVTPNTTYSFSVWVDNTVGSIGNNGMIQVASIPWSNKRYTNFTPPQGEYGQETFQFSTLSSETQIQLEVGYSAPAGTVTAMTLDDWSLTQD